MNPGRLNRRITIQSKSVSRASNGEEIVTWSDVATVWGYLEQLRGREYFAGAEMQDAIDVRVIIRDRANVAREMRLVTSTGILDIVSVIENDRVATLELMCVSGIRNGRG